MLAQGNKNLVANWKIVSKVFGICRQSHAKEPGTPKLKRLITAGQES